MWGFRDLILEENSATCSYIIPDLDMEINGEVVFYDYVTDVEFEY